MNNKPINKLLNILLVLCIAVTFSGCKFFHRKAEQQRNYKQIILDEPQEINAKIQTEIIQERPLMLEISIPAQFEPITKDLDITYAPINGKTTNVFVQIGDIVKVGQPLIEIKSDAIGQMQLEFLSQYIDVTSQIKQMTAQYNVSYKAYVREKTLYQEGISARSIYEVAYAQMLKDKADLDSLKIKKKAILQVYAQRVALYGGDASTIARAAATQRIYPYITLRANKHGVILERKVNPGEIIEQNRELFRTADLSTIWLSGYAFEKDVPYLKVGQSVKGIFEEGQKKPVKGTLSYVASIMDPETKTLDVKADIPNKDFAIKPNVYSEMIVDIGTIDTLAVPNTALQKYGDYTFAYVKVAPHTYEERKVELGHSNDKYTQIKSGLKLGEEVVTNGSFSILGESIKHREE